MGQDEERERRLPRSRRPIGIDDALVAARQRAGDRPPLPSGPLRRGDHGRGPVRPALGRLGSGRKPPARAKGAHGPRHPVRIPGMLPLRDNVPTRRFPIVTVAIIASTSAVWIFCELAGPEPVRDSSMTAPTSPASSATTASRRIGRGGSTSSLHVHARRLGAHPRQHALPLDLRQQRRGHVGRRPLRRSSTSPAGVRGDCAQIIVTLEARLAAPRRRSRTSARAARSRPCSAHTSCCFPGGRVLTWSSSLLLLRAPGDPLPRLLVPASSSSSRLSVVRRSRRRAAASRSSPTSAGSSSASSPSRSSRPVARDRCARRY